jgi:hypothetical protein
MSSPANKNKNTSGGNTTDDHKLGYNMTTVAEDTTEDKSFGGDDVGANTGGDDEDGVNTDSNDENTKTGGSADDKITYGSNGEANKREADSSYAEVLLDPASQAALLSEYDDQWPKTPSAPPSSKTSITRRPMNKMYKMNPCTMMTNLKTLTTTRQNW